MQADIDHAICQAGERRPQLRSLRSAQIGALACLRSGLDDADRRLMLHVWSGGLYTPHIRSRMSGDKVDACRMCG
eukprot:7506779-Alexandrium_andersonii.AAC.1